MNAGFVDAVPDLALIMLAPPARIFRPRWNQSPAHQRQFPDGLLGVLPNNRDRLGRRDVVPGTPVLLSSGDGGEILLDKLLPPRKSIAAAHWEIIADSGLSCRPATAAKRKRPRLTESWSASFEQPSPEVCSLPTLNSVLNFGNCSAVRAVEQNTSNSQV